MATDFQFVCGECEGCVCVWTFQLYNKKTIKHTLLVGGFNPSEKYVRQNGAFPPSFGMNKNNNNNSFKNWVGLPSLKLTART